MFSRIDAHYNGVVGCEAESFIDRIHVRVFHFLFRRLTVGMEEMGAGGSGFERVCGTRRSIFFCSSPFVSGQIPRVFRIENAKICVNSVFNSGGPFEVESANDIGVRFYTDSWYTSKIIILCKNGGKNQVLTGRELETVQHVRLVECEQLLCPANWHCHLIDGDLGKMRVHLKITSANSPTNITENAGNVHECIFWRSVELSVLCIRLFYLSRLPDFLKLHQLSRSSLVTFCSFSRFPI
ncbi:MAG: hypothetical protein J3Q66DRAFT_367797 [Benniella sp.]|nr:MAG: hypothetical protein J3Q66DRAFT_367797 [Benniella sp.]